MSGRALDSKSDGILHAIRCGGRLRQGFERGTNFWGVFCAAIWDSFPAIGDSDGGGTNGTDLAQICPHVSSRSNLLARHTEVRIRSPPPLLSSSLPFSCSPILSGLSCGFTLFPSRASCSLVHCYPILLLCAVCPRLTRVFVF